MGAVCPNGVSKEILRRRKAVGRLRVFGVVGGEEDLKRPTRVLGDTLAMVELRRVLKFKAGTRPESPEAS